MAVCGCSMANDEPQQSGFVAEVIVKFSSDERIGEVIGDSLSKGGELNSEINRFAAALSKETGIPFEAARITSGRELILEVRPDELLTALEEHVSQAPDVAECHRSSGDRSSPRAREEVLVSFLDGSQSFAALERMSPTASRQPDPALTELAEPLIRGFDYPVISRRLPSGELALSIDVNALTISLVEMLPGRDDVEYAQPNFIVRYD